MMVDIGESGDVFVLLSNIFKIFVPHIKTDKHRYRAISQITQKKIFANGKIHYL